MADPWKGRTFKFTAQGLCAVNQSGDLIRVIDGSVVAPHAQLILETAFLTQEIARFIRNAPSYVVPVHPEKHNGDEDDGA